MIVGSFNATTRLDNTRRNRQGSRLCRAFNNKILEQLSTPDHSLGETDDDEDELVTPKKPVAASRKRKSPVITRTIVAKRQKQSPVKNPWLSSDDEPELPTRTPSKSKKATASNRKRFSEDSANVAKNTTKFIGTIEITSSEDECQPVKKERIDLGIIDLGSNEEPPAIRFREEGGIYVLLSSEDEEPTEPPSSTETTPVAPPFPIIIPSLLPDADEENADSSITPTKDDTYPAIDPLNDDSLFSVTEPPATSSYTALGTTVIFAKALLSIVFTYMRRQSVLHLLLKHTDQTELAGTWEVGEDRKQMAIDLVAGLLASKNAKYKWVREEKA